MANVIAVKGIKQLVNQLGDSLRETANKMKDGYEVDGRARLTIDGEFAYNKKGEIGLVGKVGLDTDILDLPIEAELAPAVDFVSGGDGTGQVTITYELEMRPVDGEQ